MLALGLVDGIIPEPSGGAHNDYDAATALVDQALSHALDAVTALSVPERLDARYAKFRGWGKRARRLPIPATERRRPLEYTRRAVFRAPRRRAITLPTARVSPAGG